MKIYIDEAWRGPLAWPLYVWLIIPLKRFIKKDFKDSKKLTAKNREKLFQDIEKLEKKGSIIYSIWIVNNKEIDQFWITKSINLAIKRWLFDIFKKYYKNYLKKSLSKWLCSCDIINKFSIENLIQDNFSSNNLKNLIQTISQTNPISKIIIDWNSDFGIKKDLEITVDTVIKWDDKVIEISMASIVAKVNRDQRMINIAQKKYIHYNFKKNKWYGTLEHRNSIKKYWICEIHRKLFLKKLILT